MRVALGAGAAAAAWLAVLVALNVTGDPVVCGGAFVGLAVLAIRTGQRRLLLLAIIIGLGLLLVVPGVALVDGSFELAFANWQRPSGATAWLRAVGAATRVPAQVLAAAFLLLVPSRLLLAGAARISPDTALLGAIAARLRPLLLRDVRLVRDELAGRGLRMGRGVALGERARAIVALWEALVSGMLDRAFVTAAALDARGWGVATPTTEELRHRDLRDPVQQRAATDRLLVLLATTLVVGTITLRSTGALAPAAAYVGSSAPAGAGAMLLGIIAAALGLVPLIGRAPAALDEPEAGETDEPVTPRARTARAGCVLDLQDVSMHYPTASSPSLAGASLTVAAGELVVVIGPSGGGKSTLLDVVTGAAPRITGGVRSGSVRVGRMVRDHVRETGAGLVAAVFQDPESQVLVGRVAEEVAFGLRHAGVERAQIERRVLAVLDQLAIRHLAARDCRTLSGGELQRVLLAAALVLDPVLLVLDEPTSQVDAASERRFWDAIDAARHERGIGVLVAEHRLSHLRRRADRVVIVEGGRIVADEPNSALPGAVEALVQDGYAGLVPAPVVTGGAPRLVVRVDRLEVGDDVESPRRTLLRGFDLNVPARSIVTLEGPNGAGKSTLMHAVRGLGDGACVQVDGIRRRDVGSSVQQLAYLSQGAGALLPGRSVRHAIEDTCRRLRIPIAFAHEAVAAAGLADRIDAHPSELSVGERQRLALVAATAHRPAVWLLDEPTRGMDRSSRRWVACHVLAHAAAGGVVVVATHDAALAATIATHRLRLDLRTGPSLVPVQRDRSGNVIVEAAARSAPQEVDA